MRDYFDWLAPFLTADAFRGASYVAFWIEDVRPTDVPRNRFTELVDYYQWERKVTQGNAEDLNHAGNVFDVEIVLTADKRLHHAIDRSLAHFPSLAVSTVLVRPHGHASTLDAIVEAIESI